MLQDNNIHILKEKIYGARCDGEIIAEGTYQGYEIRIISYGTHPCCYVKLDSGHRYYGKDWYDVNVGVHGGITFSEETVGDPRWSDGWWIGWDYAHAGDCMKGFCGGRTYTIHDLIEDAMDVINQL